MVERSTWGERKRHLSQETKGTVFVFEESESTIALAAAR